MFSTWARQKAVKVRNSCWRAKRRQVRRRPGMEVLESRRVLAAVFNELHIPTQFPQSSQDQYVEIRGDANEVLADGTYLVAVDGLGNPGNVRAMFDLSNVALGANGFLILTQQENKYIVHPDATELTGAGDPSLGFGGMRAPGDPDGTSRFNDNSVTGNTLAEFLLEPTTFLLIQSDTPVTIGQDIDADDDIVRDGDAADWTILDSVAVVNFGDGVMSYSPLVFADVSTTGSAEEPFHVVSTYGVSWIGRNGDTVGSAPADWISSMASEVAFLSSNYQLDNGYTFPEVFAGRRLDHVGAPNFFATISGQVFEDADGDGVKQETEAGMANVAVTLGNFANNNFSFNAEMLPPPAAPEPNPSIQNAFPFLTLTTADATNWQHPADTHSVRVVDDPNTTDPDAFAFAHGASDTAFTTDNRLRIDLYEPVSEVGVRFRESTPSTPSQVAIKLFNSLGEPLPEDTQTTVVFSPTSALFLFGRETADIAYAVAYVESGDGVITGVSVSPANRTVTTDANGDYQFSRVAPSLGAFDGVHQVRQTPPEGFTQTFPADDAPHSVTVTNTTHQTGVNFGVQRANRPPEVEDQEFAAPENSPAGTVVGTVAASDPDAGQTLTYAITGGTGQEEFEINPETGALTVAEGAVLNFEAETNSYTLEVQVTDNATPSATTTATVTIAIGDVNEPATELIVTPNGIPELADTSSGYVIGTITTNDPDTPNTAFNSYTFELDQDSPFFEIVDHNNDGRFDALALKEGVGVDFEVFAGPVPAFIERIDFFQNRAPSSVAIHVLDENEPATKVTLSSNTVSELAHTSSPVIIGALGTDDPDTTTAFNSYTFALPPDVEDNHLFELVGPDAEGKFDLALKAGVTLDHEDQPTLTVEVHAFSGESTVITTLTVEVANEEEPPQVEPQQFTVAENLDAGTVVGTVIATDPDAESGLEPGSSFSLSVGDMPFAIDADGVITTTAALDFEAQRVHTFPVTITDPTGLNDFATITVRVTDVADENEPPVAKNFAESIGPGESITFDVAAQATDADGTIDPLSAAIVTGPQDGTATVGADGRITYTPAEGFHGFDDFTYTVQDNQGGVSNVATITIDVSEPVSLEWQNDGMFREDVDGDGDVDISDLLAVVQFLRDNGLGFEFTTPPQPDDTLANVDGDDIASVNDLLMVVRALRDQQSAVQGEAEAPAPMDVAAVSPSVSPPVFLFLPQTDDNEEEESWEAVLQQMAADVATARG